ncbi:hypothetical protein JRQ81_003220 [Phrynocephalus forsythii]|uniref:Uncharacterized protein n=1 Tax=Phrynocephalus forsythii TaxID=171643 RepID=A0A9Q0XJE9_9SAUR|nr:hypothetical protein JRQ81_003220 [Phrynocephalus forsythii]
MQPGSCSPQNQSLAPVCFVQAAASPQTVQTAGSEYFCLEELITPTLSREAIIPSIIANRKLPLSPIHSHQDNNSPVDGTDYVQASGLPAESESSVKVLIIWEFVTSGLLISLLGVHYLWTRCFTDKEKESEMAGQNGHSPVTPGSYSVFMPLL